MATAPYRSTRSCLFPLRGDIFLDRSIDNGSLCYIFLCACSIPFPRTPFSTFSVTPLIL